MKFKKYGYAIAGKTTYDVIKDGKLVGQVWKAGKKAWRNSHFATVSLTRRDAAAWLVK